MELVIGRTYVAKFGEGTETSGKDYEFVVIKKFKKSLGVFEAIYLVKWTKGRRGKIYGGDFGWCVPYAFDETCGGDEFELVEKEEARCVLRTRR